MALLYDVGNDEFYLADDGEKAQVVHHARLEGFEGDMYLFFYTRCQRPDLAFGHSCRSWE